MSPSQRITVIGAVGIFLIAGVSYAVWKVSFTSHPPVQVARVEPEEDEPESDHTSDNFLNEEKARFKTKSGVEVVLSSYSECEACDAPEFLGIQTEADAKVNAIPSPQEHNFSETPDAHLKATIVFGECSDDIMVYHELVTGQPVGNEKKKGPEYTKYIATILPSGRILIKKEVLNSASFQKIFKRPAPNGCEVIHQDDVFAISN